MLIRNGAAVDYVFIGDSITQGCELYAYFGDKAQVLINRGIGGDKSKSLRQRFEADALQLKPRHIVLCVGINDTWVLDDFTCEEEKLVQCITRNVVTQVTALAELCERQGQSLILCSILPTNLPQHQTDRTRNLMLVQINAAIRELAGELGFVYVDYHSELTGEDGITLRHELAGDGIHPNVSGYDIMARILRNTLALHDIVI
ncbi:SGNH/GDSL hydrolase family protein [Paenibacillus roseipurpureus]|uniref:GDSL-type esterase/lipase family protein n=1 Tax=Paenibacillus roseopurpureus TaxID=2918901 RepID=A0AA96LQA8_9BACL|nr:GDSL-type esterase/lipase family protein [Paenibacillus sp. MBLB1832]WNR42910.1 GDSL-type esterase/lipase family protein [Paenibacillus sp. MBLB1832]